jgi:hypothetical protein
LWNQIHENRYLLRGYYDSVIRVSETLHVWPHVDPQGFGFTYGVAATGFASAVPEPSTWAMMLLGFAGLGFAFRQSRHKVSFA